jgi:hypothetical protein
MKARIALLGGMGYPATELSVGMPAFKAHLEALGAKVLLVSWSHRQDVYNFMHGFDGFRAYCGDSLGAGSAAQYPGDINGPVDFAGGFQPSVYDARAHCGRIEVARNVARAHCIYDPVWTDSLGLGNAEFVITPGATTKLLITQHRGAHPDDWSFSQNIMLHSMELPK